MCSLFKLKFLLPTLDEEKSSPPKSSRAFNPAIDDVRGVKFSARVQSSRKHVIENPSHLQNDHHNNLPKPSLKQSPPLSKSSNNSTNKNAVTKSRMRTITPNIVVSQREQKVPEKEVKAENVDDQLDSLMSALDKLENPTQQKLTHSVFQSQEWINFFNKIWPCQTFCGAVPDFLNFYSL